MIRENVLKVKGKSNAPARGPVAVMIMDVLSAPVFSTKIVGVMYLQLAG